MPKNLAIIALRKDDCTLLVLGLLGGLTVAAYASDWEIEYADSPKVFAAGTDRSLAICENTGDVSIAYGGDHLYVARFDGTAWASEVADDAPVVGMFASIAFDSSGYPHISHTDAYLAGYGALLYTYWDGNAWHTEIPDDGAFLCEPAACSIKPAFHTSRTVSGIL